MAKIVLCCGKVCSGKSTFTSYLKNQFKYYTFSADQWMLHFYEETPDRKLFSSQLNQCKEKIYEVCDQVLEHGGNVALDFGFWTREERDYVRHRFEKLGVTVHFIYFPVDFQTQIEYMKRRQENLESLHYTFTEETLTDLNSRFEEPGTNEPMMEKDEYLRRFSVE